MAEGNSLGTFFKVIVIAAVFLAFGLLVMDKFSETIAEQADLATASQEAVTVSNASYTALTYNNLDEGTAPVVVNRSGGFTIQPANYTIDYRNGRIMLTDDGQRSSYLLVNVTYTYYDTGNLAAYGAMNDSLTAVGDVPDWIPIIVIGFVAMLVFLYFSGAIGGRKGAA